MAITAKIGNKIISAKKDATISPNRFRFTVEAGMFALDILINGSAEIDDRRGLNPP
jgi:hypothetical protein